MTKESHARETERWKTIIVTSNKGAATKLPSITTKHHYNNKIKYLIIFQDIDSEVTKSTGHFGMSSFKKIHLIFHPTCGSNLHY